ncbi:uncharacterized protein K460DRAFT_407816 [Cucurbitaria berberidis CBS 394.84]|uniref:RING-type domain-containing protein n=1 Tax=Cucurbitaria berberidis CBS 394.84 TaxID=1168544 RepID=A0A9P4GDM6_9PLEO|nr:uncharacterized protein K460DRAFT_407816 [Cucurbitaria berberidis CBS 394.84]KAF1843462.1 hypothetical protein K460DRAFT_407816 [Cucurbitaria berberidis CBS 394.84]
MSSYKFQNSFCQKPPGQVNGNSLDPHKSCYICFDTYNPITGTHISEEPVQLACGHVFGAACIEKWISIKNTCPLCRTEIYCANNTMADPQSRFEDIWLDPDIYTVYHPNPDEEMHCPASKAKRRSTRRKVSSSDHTEIEDVWVSIAFDDDTDDDVDYHGSPEFTALVLFGHEFTLTPFDKQPKFADLDSLFDDLLAGHEQWMAESIGDAEVEVEEELPCNKICLDATGMRAVQDVYVHRKAPRGLGIPSGGNAPAEDEVVLDADTKELSEAKDEVVVGMVALRGCISGLGTAESLSRALEADCIRAAFARL